MNCHCNTELEAFADRWLPGLCLVISIGGLNMPHCPSSCTFISWDLLMTSVAWSSFTEQRLFVVLPLLLHILCSKDDKHSYFGTLVTLVVICAILYFIYTRFMSGTPHQQDAPPPYSAEPPPPGFRPEYATPPCGGNSAEYFMCCVLF